MRRFVFLLLVIEGGTYCSADIFNLFRQALTLSQSFPSKAGVNNTNGISQLNQLVRKQDEIEPGYSFPCDTNRRSFYFGQPNNIRDIGPGSISVVAAVGDSIIAGIGALSQNLLGAFKRYPQQSFAMGGGKTWREYLTVPNILKEYNPRLRGYSTGPFSERGLNFAEPGAKTQDVIQQAEKLVSYLQSEFSESNSSYYDDWKLVFVMVGANDMCQLSCNVDNSEDVFENNMRTALDILYQLPRVLVAVVSVPDVSEIQSALHRPLVCQKIVRELCPCVAGSNAIQRKQFLTVLEKYRDRLENLKSSGRYSSREDAAVIVLRSLENLHLPKDKSLKVQIPVLDINLFPDLSYLAPDCFHPSQKLNAMASGMVWEELFTGVPQQHPGDSDNGGGLNLYCPPPNKPFFKTS